MTTDVKMTIKEKTGIQEVIEEGLRKGTLAVEKGRTCNKPQSLRKVFKNAIIFFRGARSLKNIEGSKIKFEVNMSSEKTTHLIAKEPGSEVDFRFYEQPENTLRVTTNVKATDLLEKGFVGNLDFIFNEKGNVKCCGSDKSVLEALELLAESAVKQKLIPPVELYR